MVLSNNPQSHQFVTNIHGDKRVYRVRTVDLDGRRWFVMADVKLVLGFDATRVVAKLRNSGDVKYLPIRILGGSMKDAIAERPCISMNGLLEIAQNSRKSTAPKFREWLADLAVWNHEGPRNPLDKTTSTAATSTARKQTGL